ncbi:hypothetical protein BLNAU_16328 [Blattamonas nauphoetae]|uniref:Uncharacterized protein n=1 Tax=Blattamonas nauphoetae TaxID=2049346 RepID=A0ABQ9XBS7_9EUKA|nr:hypothetical protein BLNAU_16328 [Blattamonas nauphoetae]
MFTSPQLPRAPAVHARLAELGNEEHSAGMEQNMGKTVHRMLRMGIEDVIEEKLLNDTNGSFGATIIFDLIKLNSLPGVDIPKLR